MVSIFFRCTCFRRQLSKHIKHVALPEYIDCRGLNAGLCRGEGSGDS